MLLDYDTNKSANIKIIKHDTLKFTLRNRKFLTDAVIFGTFYKQFIRFLHKEIDLTVVDVIAVESNCRRIFRKQFVPEYFIACGIILSVLYRCHPHGLYEYTPEETRKITTGSCRAKKPEVEIGVRARFVDLPQSFDEHQIDALATALCFIDGEDSKQFIPLTNTKST